jgi:hypothetical protein
MMSSPHSRRDLLLLGTAAGAAVLMDSPLLAQAQRPGSAGTLPVIDVKRVMALSEMPQRMTLPPFSKLSPPPALRAAEPSMLHRGGTSSRERSMCRLALHCADLSCAFLRTRERGTTDSQSRVTTGLPCW